MKLPTTINMSRRQGSGKTHAALPAADQAAVRASRVITIDPGLLRPPRKLQQQRRPA